MASRHEIEFVDGADAVIRDAVHATAEQLASYVRVVRPPSISESRSLRFPFVLGLAQALEARGSAERLRVNEEVAYHASAEHFVGARGVDVAISGPEPDRPPLVAVELKASPDDLHECLWDAVKLSVGLRQGLFGEAYLVAAARQDQWARSTRVGWGFELFADGAYEIAQLLEVNRYSSAFSRWKRQNGQGPRCVPKAFRTTNVATVEIGPLGDGGDIWELRAAKVIDVPSAADTVWPLA